MTKYIVDLTKPKKNQPAYFPQEWYRGGTHVFDNLNDARADAIKMYLKGWRSGSSYRVAQAFDKSRIDGVQIYKNKVVSPFDGAVVRYNNKFYYVLNISQRKYELNMDGSVKTVKKTIPSPFGL